MKAAHQNIAPEKGGCTTCHDPHGSGKKGLLLAFGHKPYEDKTCASCHDASGARIAEGSALCVKCHAPHAGDATKPVPHAAVVNGKQCLNCHSPHAGKTKSLLIRDDLAKTCKSCHDRSMFEKAVKHPEQDCETCHDPHGSENASLLVEKQKDLCLGCHTDVPQTHAHPFSAPAKDPRTGRDLNCTSCHDPHSSDQPQLLLGDKKRELCVQCHLGGNMEAHSPGGK